MSNAERRSEQLTRVEVVPLPSPRPAYGYLEPLRPSREPARPVSPSTPPHGLPPPRQTRPINVGLTEKPRY